VRAKGHIEMKVKTRLKAGLRDYEKEPASMEIPN
jgi:hypothetical protein